MAGRSRSSRRDRLAFTLIEMLVVMIILVLLFAIVVPAFVSARKKAKRVRTELDMQTIRTALEEWKKDHQGRYPQVAQNPAPNPPQNCGFAVLARELMGIYGDGVTGTPPNTTVDTTDPPTYVPNQAYMPGDCVAAAGGAHYVALVDQAETGKTPIAPGSDPTVWAAFSPLDGHDGPGVQISSGGKSVSYLPDTFRHRGCALLDQDNNPILYFPARGNANIHKLAGNNPTYCWPAGPNARFDPNDNLQFFARQDDSGAANVNAVKRIQGMLGDMNFNGIVDDIPPNIEEARVSNAPYVLWAAGPDRFYGPKTRDSNQNPTVNSNDVSKCDDIIVTP